MVKLRKKVTGTFLKILIGIMFIITILNTMPISAEEVHQIPLKEVDMAPFYWIVGIVGGCIAATLTYVSWQKYKSEEKNQTKTRQK